jgi:hypothetical protein
MLHEFEPVANFGFARRFELSPPLGLFLCGGHRLSSPFYAAIEPFGRQTHP